MLFQHEGPNQSGAKVNHPVNLFVLFGGLLLPNFTRSLLETLTPRPLPKSTLFVRILEKEVLKCP